MCLKGTSLENFLKYYIHDVFTCRTSMHIKQVYLKLTWCIDKAVHTIEDYPMARLDNKTT